METGIKHRAKLNNVNSFHSPNERTPLLQVEQSGDTGVLLSNENECFSYSAVHLSDSESSVFDSSNLYQKFSVGVTNLLSQKYECLDYDVCENTLFTEEQNRKFKFAQVPAGCSPLCQFASSSTISAVMRWFVICLIGIFTALIACVITITIEELANLKFRFLHKQIELCTNYRCLITPYAYWILICAVSVAVGSMLVVYIAPVAAGSGIPVIKCYLNGVKVPEVVRLKTLIVKAAGIIASVVGGLAVGKEGPMIHCGAVIAAGISQGKSTTLRKDCKVFEKFREDHEKRDFVSAGAAAGVSAAFGAPVGGVLFSLEEGASFWNQSLTWRIFFCSMVSYFTLNSVLSAYHGHAGQLSYPGLVNFGKFDNINYTVYELPIYIFMGVLGGLLGALYNQMNYLLTVFRMRYVTHNLARVFEVIMVGIVGVSIAFLMTFIHDSCVSDDDSGAKYQIQADCEDGKYKAFGNIWLQIPESTLRSLFHDLGDTWSAKTLAIFSIAYLFLGCWTYGLYISSGLFIPTLLIGAAWGRLFGAGVMALTEYLNIDNTELCGSKFAIIGAAAMLGGVVRMTISLTVILMEAIGNITFGLPIMIAVMTAKWIGDIFNEGLYDIHIQLASVPLLGWEPPEYSFTICASEIMSCPVVCLRCIEKVGYIETLLKTETHNGFPIVDVTPESWDNIHTFGTFRGMILRWQLIVLLQHKVFNETREQNWQDHKLTLKDFRNSYPRHPTIQQIHISPLERGFTIDLRPFMNPSAYTISHRSSLPRIFRLFRGLGLRHLPVIDDKNSVVGIVTRKDIARYRERKHGKVGVEELQVSYG